MSYITYEEFMRHMALETLVRKAQQDWKDSMEKHNHEEQACHWPPPNHELAKFSYPSSVNGYSHFALHGDLLVSGHRALLMLHPVNPMRGVPVVAQCNHAFKWEVTCDYSMVSAVAAAIPSADVFLRNLREQSERVKLPEDCEWFEIGLELFVRDIRSGTVFPVPKDARRADILDVGVKEFRRTHPSK